ncbi:MAG: amino acid adenylation domain-containing protein [gamma proteobacterium symbiont of Taylorina sp.]|nr:amino acid adenylation domain-containing protein [gamma proteobacterium symbiont of Taylorina sp.]
MLEKHFNLAEYFYELSKNNKNTIALRYRDNCISYNELNNLSNKIAHFFLSLGIKSKDVIGIFNTKKPLGYASMLAALKVGAIYTNIDEENPQERLKKTLHTCQPKLLISDHNPSENIVNVAIGLKIELIDLSINKAYLVQNKANLELTKKTVGSHPAYIMFTSGSTGIPKGVLVSHQSILNFIRWSINRYKITSYDRLVQVSPMYFDNSVFDFYTALFSGASLAPISKEISKNPQGFVNLIDALECTILFSVPSLLVYLLTMRVLTEYTLKTIRVFTFGGEGFPKGELKKLYNLYSHRAKFINVYGPTEATCICSSYDISLEDFNDMGSLTSLGQINPNFDFIILDEKLKKVTYGDKGELCLIGPNVALGYYNDKERTAAVFIQNPVVKNYKDIIYRTGDIVYEKNGLLWFVGRTDNQIKHMGYRIELEEIESVLNGLSYISQSAVLYERVKTIYGKIIAFVATEKGVTESQIKEDLYNLLPDYMVPNIVEIKNELPKNRNGKVDKNNIIQLMHSKR